MGSPIILVDVDDTVADLVTCWIDKYNSVYNDRLTKPQIKTWDICSYVKPEVGRKMFNLLDGIYDDVNPIEGALQGVLELQDLGYRVVFVTAGFQPEKIFWLQRHGFIKFDISPSWQLTREVIMANDKSMIIGDMLIDDNPENLKTFGGGVILFTQPWNEDASLYCTSSHSRANNWKEVVSFVKDRFKWNMARSK